MCSLSHVRSDVHDGLPHFVLAMQDCHHSIHELIARKTHNRFWDEAPRSCTADPIVAPTLRKHNLQIMAVMRGGIGEISQALVDHDVYTAPFAERIAHAYGSALETMRPEFYCVDLQDLEERS